MISCVVKILPGTIAVCGMLCIQTPCFHCRARFVCGRVCCVGFLRCENKQLVVSACAGPRVQRRTHGLCCVSLRSILAATSSSLPQLQRILESESKHNFKCSVCPVEDCSGARARACGCCEKHFSGCVMWHFSLSLMIRSCWMVGQSCFGQTSQTSELLGHSRCVAGNDCVLGTAWESMRCGTDRLATISARRNHRWFGLPCENRAFLGLRRSHSQRRANRPWPS